MEIKKSQHGRAIARLRRGWPLFRRKCAANILFIMPLPLEILICIVQIRALNKQDNNKEFVICAGDAVLHTNVWHVSTQYKYIMHVAVCVLLRAREAYGCLAFMCVCVCADA